MQSMEHIRGVLNPTNPGAVDAWSMLKIERSLSRAGIKSLLSQSGNHLRGIVELQNSHRSAGPGFINDFTHRLQQFMHDGEVKPLGLEGQFLIVSDYKKEAPEIYTVYVRDGQVSYKAGYVVWEPDEKFIKN